ncbi:phage virion morphogenesis protein [Tateyamaria sp.]|uniref:phage virion morphogenesis protein n=1 Tax=Tateyamaria sp. TaxID=1929288 RepID=UPI003B211BB1
MTGARITVDYDAKALDAALSQAVAALDNPIDLMDAIGAVIEEAIDRRFDTASDASGSAWAASLRARQGKRGGKTLTDTGRLRASISRSVSGSDVAVGTNIEYAAIHHFGGEIERPARTQVLAFNDAGRFQSRKDSRARRDGVQPIAIATIGATTITMPARPFLEIDTVAEADIADVVQDFLRKALNT